MLRPVAVLGAALLAALGTCALAAHDVVVVCGHPGQSSFEAEIQETARTWVRAVEGAGHHVVQIDSTVGEATQLDRLRAALGALSKEGNDPLWVVLSGHGSAQGGDPKFSLRGPDLGASELARMLQGFRRPVFIVAGFSCAGAFVAPLAGSGRAVVAATRSGSEEGWSRFGRLFADALAGLDADADGDGQVSVLEAWMFASRKVAAAYKDLGRLATEHSVLADTPSGKGISVEEFAGEGSRQGKLPKEAGALAGQWHLVPNREETLLTPEQRAERSRLEGVLAELRSRKQTFGGEEYRRKLEAILLELEAAYRVRKQ